MLNPAVELDLLDRLQDQADTAGMRLGPYLELLLARAHGWTGPYLPDIDYLPTPVTAQQLQDRTKKLGAEDCAPVSGPTNRRVVRVDRDLAEQIETRCSELDAAYAGYLRAIFREAVGYTNVPRANQLAVEIDTIRGEARLPKAG